MRMQESAENYLEMILMLKNKNGQVRSIDVANEMSFSKASVSVAMKSFRKDGYITVDADGYISLTDSGLAIAEKIYERHSCKIEHDISAQSFDKLKEHLKRHNIL